jgi:hypothetical protein
MRGCKGDGDGEGNGDGDVTTVEIQGEASKIRLQGYEWLSG